MAHTILPDMQRLVWKCTIRALGPIGQDINLVPTPLLRSTHRTGAMLMPMPLTYDTEHATQKDIFIKAHELANPPGDPDPERDLQGHEEARWGQHSWRRFGDKVARARLQGVAGDDGRRRNRDRPVRGLGPVRAFQGYATS